MSLVDTHAHLYSEEFENDLDVVVHNCKLNNVNKVFLPSIDSTYTDRMLELKKKYPDFFYLMLGIHPSHVDENYHEHLSEMEAILERDSSCFVGIGEIGIDLYWDKTKLTFQKEAFVKQINLAKKYNFPINIHCRDAFDEVFEILKNNKDKKLKGIFHCFSGNLEQAKYIVEEFNLKLGIGGIVTFKNGKIDKFLNEIDIKNIVLETDAPYLAPAPHRGKRNDPSYIPLIANRLAEIYNIPKEKVARLTTDNVRDIYNV